MTVDYELAEHERRITKLEECQDEVRETLGELRGESSTTLLLLKWVVLPLLIILGGLVGIKVV